jgi:hypothetical protein
MRPYECLNPQRDSDSLDDWCKGSCGENPGLLRLIVDAAYEWRAAEGYLTDCFIGKCKYGRGFRAAHKDAASKRKALMTLLDRHRSELRDG